MKFIILDKILSLLTPFYIIVCLSCRFIDSGTRTGIPTRKIGWTNLGLNRRKFLSSLTEKYSEKYSEIDIACKFACFLTYFLVRLERNFLRLSLTSVPVLSTYFQRVSGSGLSKASAKTRYFCANNGISNWGLEI